MTYLKLEQQLCFPFYAISRQLTALYRPLLEKIGLTYPQYLVMMVLWEHEEVAVKFLGEKLLLDSGTLTPLLKRLEQSGLITRNRNKLDERVVLIALTSEGKALRQQAERIPETMISCMALTEPEAVSLKTQLDQLLANTTALLNESQA
ncbi:MarR family winged helix-turn-helix transcriptional regulator [Flectobacillus major]|jgi:DNA-binding MarR family transcriptional regulator|uniref:MarR family winged helix-turn-helix transcriptional regulator n=1 Tax=Flectobacillus major TaxID=103 RepID=UPI0003FB0C3F|nr:MarR family transcriptional regulator [Flectobacillus major]